MSRLRVSLFSLIALSLLLFTCGPEEGDSIGKGLDGVPITYYGEIDGTKLYCHPRCPPKDQIRVRLHSLDRLFDSHKGLTHPFAKQARKDWSISWSNYPAYKSSKGNPYHGVTRTGLKVVWIYYPYVCPNANEIQGLCGGVFDWEVGLIFMDYLFPDQKESLDKAYRIEHNLLYSEDALEKRATPQK